MTDLHIYFLISSIVVPGLHSYTYLGCFFDEGNGRVWPWLDAHNLRYYNTLEKCTEYCRGLGRRYAGSEFGSECYCGDTYPHRGFADNCNVPCVGNSSQICGGGDAMSVYFVCKNGTYKSSDGGCNRVCGQCRNGDVCHYITGECPDGCGALSESENWIDVSKCKACQDTFFWDGNTCQPCGQCYNRGDCNSTGGCLLGCKYGFKMPKCQECDSGYHQRGGGSFCEACGKCAANAACDIESGQCVEGCKGNWKPNLCKECRTGFYQDGSNCLPCGKCNTDEPCDKQTGECKHGCKDLWQAPKCLNCLPKVHKHPSNGSCSERCGQCKNGTCVEANGQCLEGCIKGWKEPLCKVCADGLYEETKYVCKQCGECMDRNCDKTNGHCSNAGCNAGFKGNKCMEWCPLKTYGLNCALNCSVNCGGNGGCVGQTGRCNIGCKPGWKEDDCETKCEEGKYGFGCGGTCVTPNYCKDGVVCHHVDGSCPGGCEPGYTGDNCSEPCGNGKYGYDCNDVCSVNCKNNDNCNRKTGICPRGCKDGWTGTHCISRCSGNFYGSGCNTSCGQCAGDGKCTFDNGHCDQGCKPGYKMDKCISECGTGFFGQNCEGICGNCATTDVCNPIHGDCPNDCKSGWTGNKCKQVCPEGYFGLGCIWVCGQCEGKCHAESGQCDPKGCKPGYIGMNCSLECDHGFYGKNCTDICQCQTETNKCDHINGTCPVIEQEQSTGTPGAAVGGSLAAIILIAVLVIVIIVILRLRKKSKNEENTNRYKSPTDFESSDHENAYTNMADELHKEETAISIPPTAAKNKQQKSYQNNQLTTANVSGKPILPVKPIVKAAPPSSGRKSEIYENKDLRLKISKVGAYIKKLKQDEKGFENEYVSLPDGQTAPWVLATSPENSKAKNRYRNIYAYDHSRVPLNTVPQGSGYINANYINGYKAKNKFIATQGPRNTCDDLWTMIWEQNVTMVVMVTNLREGDKKKCDKYWPDVECETSFDGITVRNTKEQEMPGFTIRTLQVNKENIANSAIYNNTGKSERQVLQYHFTEWPDKDVPKHGTAILNFVRKVKKDSIGLKAPIVVHCSAGVGRTGTFIAIDYLLDQAKAEKMIDVYTCVKEMRENRIKMVQTMEQYIFIYDTMYEAVMVGDTSIQCFEFGQVYSSMKTVNSGTGISRLEEQYKMLKSIAKEEIQERNIEAALSEENIHKNRSKDVLPANSHRMYLTTTIPERNYYINSVFSKSYNTNHGVVLTQLPLLDTVVDFWRMVYDYNIDSIVMLTNYQEKASKMVSYWPFETDIVDAGPFTIRQKDMKRTGTIICCHLVLEYRKESKEVYLAGTVDWPDDKWKPNNGSTFYELFSTIQTWQQKQKNPGKIVIQCLDGGMNSGMYAVVSWMFDMINAEQAVDIFQITKQVVTARPEFLVEKEQYEEFYKIAENYMKNFQTYSNFQ